MNVTFLDHFYLDGFDFSGIGRGMLKCTNQLNYKTSPGRQGDFTANNINQFESGVIPQVEIGFMLIDINLFHKLRKLLLSKRLFMAIYFDVDFGRYVVHEMYAHPDELKDFLNRGTDIIGLQNFKLTLVGTLKGKDIILPEKYGVGSDDPIGFDVNSIPAKFKVSFENGKEYEIKWGRSMIVPEGEWAENYNKLKIDNENILIKGGDRLNVYEDYTFIQV